MSEESSGQAKLNEFDTTGEIVIKRILSPSYLKGKVSQSKRQRFERNETHRDLVVNSNIRLGPPYDPAFRGKVRKNFAIRINRRRVIYCEGESEILLRVCFEYHILGNTAPNIGGVDRVDDLS